MSLQVETYPDWESLPPDVRATQPFRCGPSFLVIRWPHDSPEVRHSQVDNDSFYGDYGWIKRAIQRAFEAGRSVGR